MKSYIKYVITLGCIVHFGTIAALHIPSLPNSIYVTIRYNNVLGRYALLSGIHGGYSFFSPSVGNVYQIQHHIKSTTNATSSRTTSLRSRAGTIRYQSYLDIGNVFLSENKETEPTKELARQGVIRMNKQMVSYFPCDTVHSTLMTKLIPTLQQLRAGATLKTQYLSLFSYVEHPNCYP